MLHDADPSKRLQAARSLGVVSRETITPPIGDANLDSLRSETDPEVVMELLFGTHLLTEQRPRDVLDVIERRGWTRAKPFNPVTAMAIAVAGDAAIADPNRAAALLPGITDFDPLHQPLIAEAVTYSWWRIAKLIPEIGRKELGRIAKLTGADCHDEWIIFVKQAALVALLALECLDQGFEDGLDGRYGPYRTGKWHIFLDIDPLSKSHAAALGANADIVAAAIAQVAEEGRPPLSHNLAPWGPLAPARRVCADHSRTLLVEMAVASSDPPAFVSALPRDRTAAEAAARILSSNTGAREIAAAKRIDKEVREEPGENREVLQLRSALARLSPSPRRAWIRYRDRVRISIPGDELSVGFAAITDKRLETMIPLLEAEFDREEALHTVFFWRLCARTWQGALIARVYHRMFVPDPVTHDEAMYLVDGTICALRDEATQSRSSAAHLAAYSAIHDRLNGELRPPPSMPAHGLLQRSLLAGVELLQVRSLDHLIELSQNGENFMWWPNVQITRGMVGRSSPGVVPYPFPGSETCRSCVFGKRR